MPEKPQSASHQGHADPDKHGKEQYKRHVDGSIRVSGQIEVHPPPNTHKEETTEEKKARSYRFLNFVVAVLTLLAVVIYAALTAWQACLTRTAIKDARDHFAADQRPYVWNSAVIINPIRAGQTEKLIAHIFFANYGKSPSLNEKGRGKVFFGPNAKTDADNWFKDQEGKSFEDSTAGSSIVLPPGVVSDPAKTTPSAGSYTSIESDKVPKPDDVAYMDTHEGSIYIAHRERYFDLAGNHHYSDMCWYNLKTKAVASCPAHNEIH